MRIIKFLQSGWDEVRFRLSDRQARKVAADHAKAEFPTDILEQELSDARTRLAFVLDDRFDTPMRANRSRLMTTRAREAELSNDLATLTRDHRGELDSAYAELEELKADMAVAKSKVSDASDDLRGAKARISSWHNRSKSRIPIYGKRGKRIPRHSFFFFSESDLDAAKRDADRAARAIGDAIRRRDRIGGGLDVSRSYIGEIKASRTRRRTLLEAGRTPSKITGDLRALRTEATRLEEANGRLSTARESYAEDGADAVHIAEIKECIADLLRRRAERLGEFDTMDAGTRRRERFHQNRSKRL